MQLMQLVIDPKVCNRCNVGRHQTLDQAANLGM
jgi:hypothetical protein